MNKSVPIVALLCAASSWSSQENVAAVRSQISEDYASFAAVEEATFGKKNSVVNEELSSAYSERFARRQSKEAFRDLSNDDVELLFRAAREVTFYTSNSKYIDDMRSDLRELESRGVAKDQVRAQFFEELIQVRNFEAARQFQGSHPLLRTESIPVIQRDSNFRNDEPSALVLDQDGHTLIRRSFDLNASSRIVVVGHPFCHFTQNAIRDIATDFVLANAFKRNAIWLAPQDGRLELDAFRAWNVAHPDYKLSIVYRESEWPMLDIWGTPTFYFFRSGKLESIVQGWPEGGNRNALLAALGKVGLLTNERSH